MQGAQAQAAAAAVFYNLKFEVNFSEFILQLPGFLLSGTIQLSVTSLFFNVHMNMYIGLYV